jgi:hypothetical protein
MTKQEFLRQGKEIAARMKGQDRIDFERMLAETASFDEYLFEFIQ